MNYTDVLQKVCERGGLNADEGQRALTVVTEVLAKALEAPDRAALVKELPLALSQQLQAARSSRELGRPVDFFEEIRRNEGVSAGFGKEHTEIVCDVLAQEISGELRLRLRNHLPAPIGALFESAERESEEDEDEWTRPLRISSENASQRISSGRPGSRSPLSEGHTKAQTHSVLRSGNPHADTKLSSAKGTTQERERETLAEGKPDRPLFSSEE